MLIPGFLAGDPSLRRMAGWLRTGGWDTTRSGMRLNVGCMGDSLRGIERQLEQAVDRAGHPAVVIGQSRGGVFGRVLAVRRPDLVDTLVTLGSPVLNHLAVRHGVWASLGAVGLLGTLGVPGLFRLSCITGSCCTAAHADLASPFPADVNFVSIYSRRDEVIRWQACLDPAATQLEVPSSHLGMALDVRVWQRVASLPDRVGAACERTASQKAGSKYPRSSEWT